MRVPCQRFGRKVRVALAVIATLAAAGHAGPDAAKDKDGRFAADFPAAVKRTNEVFDTEAGQMITCQVIAVDGARSYMVTYCDYPEGHVASTGAAAVHKRAAKDAANNAKGNIRSDESRQLGEVAGREVLTEGPDGRFVMRLRLHIVGDHLFQVAHSGPPGSEAGRPALGFLDSFRLLPADG